MQHRELQLLPWLQLQSWVYSSSLEYKPPHTEAACLLLLVTKLYLSRGLELAED